MEGIKMTRQEIKETNKKLCKYVKEVSGEGYSFINACISDYRIQLSDLTPIELPR